ncbi:MAG: hypothetical protein DI565_13070 [Ancylobacter novellus]|uniref:Uncharacterized protein n=1 Tax=Ancylobacter novellus TaxID=921 RepID=A0A2W5MA90_ANCNO|nr:MAG: hypothetical protein DI565_13070 [Ancylobacter novellus]
MTVAFTTPGQATRGALACGAAVGLVGAQAMSAAISGIAAQANDRLNRQAYAAWHGELDAARGNAVHLADVAELVIGLYGAAQNRVDDLEAEVIKLRRAVAQRDAALGALSRRRAS